MDNLKFENILINHKKKKKKSIIGRGGESCGVKTKYMLNGVVEKRKPKNGDS